MVVYQKINSVMNLCFNEYNPNTVLTNVPKNYQLTLFVVKKIKDKMYFALKDANTSQKKVSDFDFQELTPEKLEAISKKFGAA